LISNLLGEPHPFLNITYIGTASFTPDNGGSIFDEKIILNKSTPGIYPFLCKNPENRKK
jgi:hypothetical protein